MISKKVFLFVHNMTFAHYYLSHYERIQNVRLWSVGTGSKQGQSIKMTTEPIWTGLRRRQRLSRVFQTLHTYSACVFLAFVGRGHYSQILDDFLGVFCLPSTWFTTRKKNNTEWQNCVFFHWVILMIEPPVFARHQNNSVAGKVWGFGSVLKG